MESGLGPAFIQAVTNEEKILKILRGIHFNFSAEKKRYFIVSGGRGGGDGCHRLVMR